MASNETLGPDNGSPITNRPLINALARVNVDGVGTLAEARVPSAKQDNGAMITWDDFTSTGYEHDMHFQCCEIVDPYGNTFFRPRESGEKLLSVRLRKDTLPALRAEGWDIRCTMYVADFDWRDNANTAGNPDTKTWDDERKQWARENLPKLQSRLVAMNLGYTYTYFTHHGLRCVHVYDEPVSCGEQEHIMAAMIEVYAQSGFMIDTNVGDWTRLFRGPRVKRQFPKEPNRPDERTWACDWFADQQTDELMSSAKALLLPAPEKKRQKTKVKVAVPFYAGEQPTPEECLALFEERTNGGKGPQKKTFLYKKLKAKLKRIGDDDLYQALADMRPIPIPEGERDATLIRLVGLLVVRLYTEDYIHGPEPIYAILLPTAQEFAQDQDWPSTVWSMCARMWTEETAQHKATEVEQQKAEAKAKSEMDALIEAHRRRYPDDPQFKGNGAGPVQAVKQRALLKRGKDIYVMQPDGTFVPRPCSIDTLPNHIRRARVADWLIPMMEMRGNNLVEASPRTLLNRHGQEVDSIEYSARAAGAAYLRDDGDGRTILVLPCYSRRSLAPRFHREVHRLLRRAYGRNCKMLYLWCGEALAFDEMRPLPVLLIIGESGSTKTLLALGLGSALSSRSTVNGRNAFRKFNGQLRHSPIVLCDEEIPVLSREDGTVAELLRTRVGGDPRIPLEPKGAEVVVLEAFLRIMVTSNSEQRAIHAIMGSGDLDADDLDAIANRVLVIHSQRGVARWLSDYAEQNGRLYTEGWLHQDVLAEHFLWCHANRDRLRTDLEGGGTLPRNSKHGRLLLPPNAHNLLRIEDASSTIPDMLVRRAAEMFIEADAAVLNHGIDNVARCGRNLLFTVGPLVDQTGSLLGPTRPDRLKAIERLCVELPPTQRGKNWRPGPGVRPARWRALDTDFVLTVLRSRGMDDIANALAAVRDGSHGAEEVA